VSGGEPLLEFLEVMRQLRAECAWKAGQTHRSLARYLLEETHETLEAIDAGDATGDWGHLREELGDLLLQVYFHAVIAEESGEFTLDDVAHDIIAKMRRRNPHVFTPEGQVADSGSRPSAESINEVWESIKAQEKSRTSVTDGLPPGLPALLYADKVLDRLARAGSGVQNSHLERAQAPLRGEQAPLRGGEGDLGDRLLALVAEARETGTDPEQALRDAVRRLL
jgi:XTP/dITP diphosphohydrolase